MVIRIYLVLMLWMSLGYVFGQHSIFIGNNPCDKVLFLKDGINKYCNNYSDFLKIYIDSRFHNCNEYITLDPIKLDKVGLDWCMENSIYIENCKLGDNDFGLEISSEIINITFDVSKINSDPYLFYRLEMEKKLGLKYFGDIPNLSNQVEISRINKISIKLNGNLIEVNQNIYSDLLNPNFCCHYLSIKPIEVFYDKSVDAVYIYIVGNLLNDDLKSFKDPSNLYVAKIIFALKTKEINRVIMKGSDLTRYGWMYCSDFWVF